MLGRQCTESLDKYSCANPCRNVIDCLVVFLFVHQIVIIVLYWYKMQHYGRISPVGGDEEVSWYYMWCSLWESLYPDLIHKSHTRDCSSYWQINRKNYFISFFSQSVGRQNVQDSEATRDGNYWEDYSIHGHSED